MKKIIISGASGYIGKIFIEKYLNDFEIIAVVRDKNKLKEFDNRIKIFEIEAFFEENNLRVDYLLNLAFPRKSEIDILLDSFDFTYRLLDKSRELGVKNIINISSQSVYDINRKEEAFETDLVRPFSLYGISKIYMEKYFEDYAKKYNLNYLNLRLGSIIGIGFEQRFINKFILKYLNDEEININENGQKFSFLNVMDACEAISEIIKSENIKLNEVYNIGALDEYYISDVVKSIEKIVRHKFNSTINIENSNQQEKKTNKVNIEKLLKEINWKPKYKLDESIKEIWSSYE